MLRQRAELLLARDRPADALAECDSSLAMLKRMQLQSGASAVRSLTVRATILAAMGNDAAALQTIAAADATELRLVPDGYLRRAELAALKSRVEAHRHAGTAGVTR